MHHPADPVHGTHENIQPLPAIVVSASTERFERAARLLAELGFRATHSRAVFVNATTKCQGFNGHRLAMRKAWSTIVARNESTAVFEDDVVPAASALLKASNRSGVLGRHIRRYIEEHQRKYDVVYLGGMGRLGQCKIAGCFNTNIRHGIYWLWSTFYTDHAKWFTPRGARFLLACTRKCIELPGWGTDSIVKHVCEHPPHHHHVGTPAQFQSSSDIRASQCPAAWQDAKLWCRPPEGHHATQISRDNPWLLFIGFLWQDRKAPSLQDTVRAKQHLLADATQGERGLVNGSVELSTSCAESGRFGLCRRCTDLVSCEKKCSWDARCVAFAFAPGGMCGIYDGCLPTSATEGEMKVLRFFNMTAARDRVNLPRERVASRWGVQGGRR